MRIVLAVFAAFVALVVTLPARQASGTDLDQLMERVLARRDENWKKLQQYVLDERETFDLAGPGGVRLYGFRRDYTWFLREGVFIRSPLRADGVTLSEEQRRPRRAAGERADGIAQRQALLGHPAAFGLALEGCPAAWRRAARPWRTVPTGRWCHSTRCAAFSSR